MRIGELARRTGVGVSTLRAWEGRFRFLQPRRSAAGHRIYEDTDVQRVETVLRLMDEGLHLAAAITRVGSAGAAPLPEGYGEELRYRQIIEAADQGIWVSKDGRTRYTNRRMAEMIGYTVEELLAIPVLEFFDPEVVPAVRERTVQVRAGRPVHFTTELRRADGSTFLAEIATTPLLTPAGRYDGAVAVVDDITERYEAETQARLRATLFDAIGEAVAAATPDGKIVYVNAAAERLLGWRAGDALGRDGRSLLAAPDASEASARIHNALLQGTPYTGTLEMIRRDGTEFLAYLTCAPAYDERGTMVGLVAAITDQSERDARELDVRNRRLRAETIALLGAEALKKRAEPDATARFLSEVVVATRRLVQADHVAAIDLIGATDELHVRVVSPTRDDDIVLPSGSRSFSGYVALAGKVVVLDGLHLDRRFEVCNVLGLPPSASAVGAPIFGQRGIVGVLIAASASPGCFDQCDGEFVQGMANIIGTALVHDG